MLLEKIHRGTCVNQGRRSKSRSRNEIEEFDTVVLPTRSPLSGRDLLKLLTLKNCYPTLTTPQTPLHDNHKQKSFCCYHHSWKNHLQKRVYSSCHWERNTFDHSQSLEGWKHLVNLILMVLMSCQKQEMIVAHGLPWPQLFYWVLQPTGSAQTRSAL